MSLEEVLLRKEEKIAYLLIQREKELNALNLNVMTSLDQAFSELEKDEEILVIIITGAGSKAFVAGADIREIKEADDQRTEVIRKGQEIFFKSETRARWSSPRSMDMPSEGDVNWPWRAIFESPRKMRDWGSLKRPWGSCPGMEVPSFSRGSLEWERPNT